MSDIQCFCEETKSDYLSLIYYLGSANCNNVFARNPQLLILNAALSALCFLASLFIFTLLVIAYSYLCIGPRSYGQLTRDFTIGM